MKANRKFAPKTVRESLPQRMVWVDRVRGVAIVLMVGYHFCFDLNYFGWIAQDFNHQPFWLGLRTLIVSLFLGLVGVSLGLANPDGAVGWRRALPRWRRLSVCAALVSLASYLMFPGSMIFFGVLHFILLASVLGWFLSRWSGRVLGWLGLVSLTLGLVVQAPFFDQPTWQWLGMMTHKPDTEDYVPLFPWLGVVLGGMALVKLRPQWLGARCVVDRRDVLALTGRHSLWAYMLHQPLLLGFLGLFNR